MSRAPVDVMETVEDMSRHKHNKVEEKAYTEHTAAWDRLLVTSTAGLRGDHLLRIDSKMYPLSGSER